MILTVTPNPLLERRLYFDTIEPGKVNRSYKETFYAGGKGINVSRQLNRLGIQNNALTFLGGENGKLLRKCLTGENISFNAVSTKDETRYSSVIIEEKNKRITSFFSPDSHISKKEVNTFIEKMDKAIQNCSIVIFAGSSPNEYTDEIFLKGIELANKYDKISILDTYGNHLKACIDKAPFALHNNTQEIFRSFGSDLNDEKSKRDFLHYLYDKGVKLSFLSDGANPVFASKFDFHYKIIPPELDIIDAVGSGDSFVAGITYALDKSFVFEDMLKLSVSLGAANTLRFDAADVPEEESRKFYDSLSVIPIGKKMKLIDDSPNY